MAKIGLILPYIFDLELSGRCNTACAFCPRHAITRGEELMTAETFELIIEKLKRYAAFLEQRDLVLPFEKARFRCESGARSPLRVVMCGMGEALLNPRCPEWLGRIRREIGIRASVVTNGLLLSEKRVRELAEAQVTVVFVSVPGVDRESYSRYMQLDWDRILVNIERARGVLGERVQITAVVPDDAPFSEAAVRAFWEARGVPIAGVNACHNRGGYLENAALTHASVTAPPRFCGVMARHNFVAWDGRVLSCCHDLAGANVCGHVRDDEFIEIAERKRQPVLAGPPYPICGRCNDTERGAAVQIIAALEEAPHA